MTEPYTFPCTDDSPLNNGYGYNHDELEYDEVKADEEQTEPLNED